MKESNKPQHVERVFPKVLKTHLGRGDQRKMFLLPYEGNLTAARFLELAARLEPHLKSVGIKVEPNMASIIVQHLSNTWRTVREKDVSLTINSLGWIDLTGQGWGGGNYKPESVVVVE